MPMEDVKCPRCKEEIDHLTVRSEEVIWYRFDHNGYEEIDKEDMTPELLEFTCPECRKSVVKTEEEAMALLLGTMEMEDDKGHNRTE